MSFRLTWQNFSVNAPIPVSSVRKMEMCLTYVEAMNATQALRLLGRNNLSMRQDESFDSFLWRFKKVVADLTLDSVTKME